MKLYQKYIPEWQMIHAIIHQHWLTVIRSYILWLSFWAVIPAFLYHQSQRIQENIPFFAVEIWLCIIFIKIVYELFNWYHDVWIVTDSAVYDLEWSLFKTNLESLHYENIEGIEIDKHRIWDSIFNKWDIVIHKFWEDELVILNAAEPYASVNILESFIHPQEEEVEETDRFDMIMDALGWVVTNYLHEHGNKNVDDLHKLSKKWVPIDPRFTLDITNDWQD